MSENEQTIEENEDKLSLEEEVAAEQIEERRKTREALIRKWDGLAENAAKVVITRKYPHWCDGHLMTLPIDLCESLEDVRSRFGGGHFSLKFQDQEGNYLLHRTVHISGDPAMDGIPLESPEEKRKRVKQEERLERLQEMQITMANQSQNNDMKEVLTAMSAQNDRYLNMILSLASRPKEAEPVDHLRQALDLVNEVRGNFSGGENSEDQALSIVQKFMENLSSEKKKHDNTPPLLGTEYLNVSGAPFSPPPQAQVPVSGAAQSAPSAPKKPVNGDPIATAFQALGDMEPVEAIAKLNQAFDALPAEKQEKVSQILGGDDNMEDPETEESVNSTENGESVELSDANSEG